MIRLYNNDEIQLNYKSHGAYKELMKEQYLYASETMDYLNKALSMTDTSYTSSTHKSIPTQEPWSKLFFPLLFKYIKTILFMAASVYIIRFMFG